MPLIVQKFGGTSVATLENMQRVADIVIASRQQGNQVVVVTSAQAKETDRLIALSNQACQKLCHREYDALIATGEQVAAALLSMVLNEKGCPARSYTGGQAGIMTDPVHTKARITSINPQALFNDIQAGIVPVVTGFQGITSSGDITTLGRGGSDTTAVALAAAIKADECQIFTDVDGVYSTDPRVVPAAKRLDRISFDEMFEMASLGSKVLQTRAVEFAGKFNVPVRVLSTFEQGEGTLIAQENQSMEKATVTSIAFDRQQAQLTLCHVPNQLHPISQILTRLSEQNIEIDMLTQTLPNQDGELDISFTLSRQDYDLTENILKNFMLNSPNSKAAIAGDKRVAKLSLIGVGMRSHPAIASKIYQVLSEVKIAIQLFSTSEIKISVVIQENQLETAVRALHNAFALGSYQFDIDGRLSSAS